MIRYVLSLVLVVVFACAVASGAKEEAVVVRLAKPNLIYVNDQAVTPDQLQATLRGDWVTIQLDPEVRLSTLRSLQEALNVPRPVLWTQG